MIYQGATRSGVVHSLRPRTTLHHGTRAEVVTFGPRGSRFGSVR